MENLTLKELTSWIFEPVLEYRFIVEFEAEITKEAKHSMSSNLINYKVDFVNKQIYFEIQQTVLLELSNVIEQFIKTASRIKVTPTNGDGSKNGSWIFEFVKPLSHEFVLDYSKKGIATHKILMSYKQMNLE